MPNLRRALLWLLFFTTAVALLGLQHLASARDDNATVLPDVRVSEAGDPDPHDETSISVSPVDDRIMVGASKVIVGGGSGLGVSRVAYYSSSDGGRSWQSSLLGLETPDKTFLMATDPSVASDLGGNFYVAALMLDNGSFDNGVYVFKSTNGGRTFGDPSPAFVDIGHPSNPTLADKCYITADTSPSSQFKNTVYAVWTSTDTDITGRPRAVIRIAHLRPDEARFSEPKTISHEGDMRGASVATGPNGEVYAAWEGIGNPKVILFNASTDGGETFLPRTAAPSVDINIHSFVGSLSPPDPTVTISGVPRMNSFPVIDVDRSSGPNRGMIYIAWAETLNRIEPDIFVKRLTPPDGGHPGIGPAVNVNSEGGSADQFFPWLSVDPSNGAVNVAFYDRRDDQGGLLLNTYLARSTDGGLTFGENFKISSASSDPRVQAMVAGVNRSAIGIGDYLGCVATRGKTHLLWTDTRAGKQEIFYGQSDSGFAGDNPPLNDTCQNARTIALLPYIDESDSSLATSSATDPASCSGVQDTHTVWYAISPAADTIIGVDTSDSNYDTVLGVFTGPCGALGRVACNDDFGNTIGNRSLLTFPARAGETYLIEVSGKENGGLLRLRAGYPTITSVEYSAAPDGSPSLKISGAGFVEGNARVIVQRDGADTILPTAFFEGPRQADGTVTVIYGTKRKLKKLVQPDVPVVVRVESPAGGDRVSLRFSFVR